MNRSRSLPRWLVLVAFVVLPLTELWVLLQVGRTIGPWWTVLALVLTAVAGGVLVRREGARAWRALREALQEGRHPTRALADGALVLVGGTLLLLPGFVTDVVGLLLVLPATRPLARRGLGWLVGRHVPLLPGPDTRRPGPGPGGPVVRGDVVE